MRQVHLKVKIKSLAEEARIIRHEEKKISCKPGFANSEANVERRASLNTHRVVIVRHEARHAQLAYAYLRGRPYRQIEAKCYTQPDWRKVEELVKRFSSWSGRNDINIKAWLAQA